MIKYNTNKGNRLLLSSKGFVCKKSFVDDWDSSTLFEEAAEAVMVNLINFR